MSDVFYKRNLAVPFFTQRDNTYIWKFLAKCQKLKKQIVKHNKIFKSDLRSSHKLFKIMFS